MITIRTLAKLSKEVHALVSSPLPDIRLAAASSSQTDPNASSSSSVSPEDDVLHLRAWLRGPPDTPYEGGYFAVDINIEKAPNFPVEPPHCTFVTQIFHPNVSRSGEICVSTLKKDWKPEYGIGHILLTIKCLLMAPNPDSALDPESARLLQEEYDEYCRIARLWTSVHAPASRCPVKLFADEIEGNADDMTVDEMQKDDAPLLSRAQSASDSTSRSDTAAAAAAAAATAIKSLPAPRTSSPGPLEPVMNVPTLTGPNFEDGPGDEVDGDHKSNHKLHRNAEAQKPEEDTAQWSPGPSRSTGLAPLTAMPGLLISPHSDIGAMPKLGSPISSAAGSLKQDADQILLGPPHTRIQTPVSAAAFSSDMFNNRTNVLGLFPNCEQAKMIQPRGSSSSEVLVRQLPVVLRRGLKRL